jgi:cytochrome b561
MSLWRYPRSQIAVHWSAALAIVFLPVTGTHLLADLPNAAPTFPTPEVRRTCVRRD